MSTQRVDQFISGKRMTESSLGGQPPAQPGRTHAVINPATGETLAQVDLDSLRSAEAAVRAAAMSGAASTASSSPALPRPT